MGQIAIEGFQFLEKYLIVIATSQEVLDSKWQAFVRIVVKMRSRQIIIQSNSIMPNSMRWTDFQAELKLLS